VFETNYYIIICRSRHAAHRVLNTIHKNDIIIKSSVDAHLYATLSHYPALAYLHSPQNANNNEKNKNKKKATRDGMYEHRMLNNMRILIKTGYIHSSVLHWVVLRTLYNRTMSVTKGCITTF